MDPLGGAILTGPGGSQPYYKGLLDKLGMKANIYRVGTYKSAVEPYMRSDQSPEAAAAMTALYGEIWDNWKAEVAKARPQAQFAQLLSDPAGSVEGAKGNLSELALSTKLVDKLGDRMAFAKFLAGKVWHRPWQENTVNLRRRRWMRCSPATAEKSAWRSHWRGDDCWRNRRWRRRTG